MLASGLKADVLIVTRQGDEHAIAVTTALNRLGYRGERWWTSDFPSPQVHSISFSEQRADVQIEPVIWPEAKFSSAWVRRPHARRADASIVHPHDLAYVDSTLANYNRSFWSLLAAEPVSLGFQVGRWINHPRVIDDGESKLLQLAIAGECGFRLPPTLVSNDREKIVSFLSESLTGTIRKSLIPFIWVEGKTRVSNLASSISIDDLNDAQLLRSYPEIYQHKLQKVSEYRILCLGQEVISIRFTAGSSSLNTVDWRFAHKFIDELGTVTLPPTPVVESCLKMCRRLGLETASFDIAEDIFGSYYFLDLNQAGQFLWMEAAGPPVLDMMCRFLLGLPLDCGPHNRVSLREIMESAFYKNEIEADKIRVRGSADRVMFVSDQ